MNRVIAGVTSACLTLLSAAACAPTLSDAPTTAIPSAQAPDAADHAGVRPAASGETPLEVRASQEGVASWYGPGFHGNLTANGEVFDQEALTAAHRALPLPSLARVTRLDTGKSILVRVNDRGPYVEGRILDVSRAAAEALDFIEQGLVDVRVEALGPADPEDRAAPPAWFDPSERLRTLQRAEPPVDGALQPVADGG